MNGRLCDFEELNVDLDELRVSYDETRDAALEVAGRLADLVTGGACDPESAALRLGLAASLTQLLRRERTLRRAIRMAVSG